MTAPRNNTKRRNVPCPNSILDRKAFETALEDANIYVRRVHMDAFYQSLHRQHYPDLNVFVDNYYKNERKLQSSHSTTTLPLKNAVTNRKNRNLKQLPKALLDFLKDPKNGFKTLTSTIDCARTSLDQTTTKLAIRLHDGHVVESVLMRYVTRDGSRASLCVSSQVGCAMGCTFCATGTMGIRGDLTSGEILEQVVHADRILAQESVRSAQQQNENDVKKKKINLELVRNVVFMGMGEPLNNYDNVVEACRALIDCKRWNLGYSKVTVSTVGVTPRIRALTRDLPEVSLALSLHAPNQELRSKIVPAAKAYKIEGLIDALDAHMMWYHDKHYDGAKFTKAERVKASTRRRAMIEYVMLEGETSTFECAHQLGKLCENRHLLVNLIPYNQTDVKDKLHCPSEEHMKEFQRIVCSYGAFCTIRRTMGADIASACGQLVVEKEKENVDPGDIEDGPFVKKKESARPAARAAAAAVPVKKDQNKAIAAVAPQAVTKEPVSSSKQPLINDDLSRWIKPLSIATGVAAACFVASSVLFVAQKRKR